MQRVTISIDEDLASRFDALIRSRGYGSRSEAVRDLVRQAVGEQEPEAAPDAHCVASLSYVYDHHIRDLAQRLTGLGHEHHDLVVATTHVHLDHEACLESVILKGPRQAVQAFAHGVQSQRGVRYGALNLIGVEPNDHHHHHAHGHDHGDRGHLTPPRG